MKENTITLKIFNFSHPLTDTEWITILSDKFCHALPFKWEYINDFNSAQVIAWDGIITPKNQSIVAEMIKSIKGNKILLLIGESQTLYKGHPIVKLLDTHQLNIVEIPGWNILPEEILAALVKCYQKLIHV